MIIIRSKPGRHLATTLLGSVNQSIARAALTPRKRPHLFPVALAVEQAPAPLLASPPGSVRSPIWMRLDSVSLKLAQGGGSGGMPPGRLWSLEMFVSRASQHVGHDCRFAASARRSCLTAFDRDSGSASAARANNSAAHRARSIVVACSAKRGLRGLAARVRRVGCSCAAWDEVTRPSGSGNCAPAALTSRGAQMDLGPPGTVVGRRWLCG
jgi:hypothetical protein